MEELLAACGAAFVITDSAHTQWTIGNDHIRKTLAWREAGGLCLHALEHGVTGHTWQPLLHANVQAGGEFSLRWNDADLSARQATTLLGARAEADAASVTLPIDLRLADALEVTLCLRARSDVAVIEQWLEVTALNSLVLPRVAPLTYISGYNAAPMLH